MSTLTSTRPSTKRATTTRSAPNATALLTQDHRDVEQLFVTFEELGPRAHKRRDATVSKIIESLSQHAAIEETVFYPAVRAAVAGNDGDILEALEEHHVVQVDVVGALGAQLVAAKATAPTRPHPRSPDTPPGNVIANAVVAPLDTATNVIGAVADMVRSAVS